jgi:hemerythrin
MANLWNDKYLIGVEEIDNQHKELFMHFGNLLEACKRGQGANEVFRLFKFLDEYVEKHFTAEEKLQLAVGYPDYEKHRLEHAKFKHQLRDLEQNFTVGSNGVYLVIATNKVMVEWLVEHISRLDRDIARFMGEQGGAPSL